MIKYILLVVSLGMTTAATANEQAQKAKTASMLSTCASLYKFKGHDAIADRLLDQALDIDETVSEIGFKRHQQHLEKSALKWGNPEDISTFETYYNAEFGFYKCDVVLNIWGSR